MGVLEQPRLEGRQTAKQKIINARHSHGSYKTVLLETTCLHLCILQRLRLLGVFIISLNRNFFYVNKTSCEYTHRGSHTLLRQTRERLLQHRWRRSIVSAGCVGTRKCKNPFPLMHRWRNPILAPTGFPCCGSKFHIMLPSVTHLIVPYRSPCLPIFFFGRSGFVECIGDRLLLVCLFLRGHRFVYGSLHRPGIIFHKGNK